MYEINIELLREELNILMTSDKPNKQKILKISQKLDVLIEKYLEKKKHVS